MRRLSFGVVLAAVAVISLWVTTTTANEGTISLSTRLSGFQEVPTPKLTAGTGSFSGTIVGGKLSYKLTYSGLSSNAFMAHIHFGQRAVAAGIFIWLCGSAQAPGPAGTPTCPAGGGTVTGTATAASVQAIPSQNVSAGDFAGAIAIIGSGNAYVNVHTTNFPSGEIRGQVRAQTED
jgi:CHRD domain-containing protein